jgi:hypothetical protein
VKPTASADRHPFGAPRVSIWRRVPPLPSTV